ncbi:MAG TPA: UV damage repair protein UvrX [Bacillota bacterium]|nr:UV damage repair protein UvrX [Bacillota bacterium]
MINDQTFPQRNILCVDMKSFYASCAAIKQGLDPLTTPLAVVGDLQREGSIVLAATPSLKRNYGIKTGSRLFEIPKDENIVIVPAEMNLYLRISVEVTRLFNKYVPKEDIHTYSVDESFLAVDGVINLWGSAEQIATLILAELKDTFGLSAAIGIGPNMLMAKLCLDLEAKHIGIAQWTYEDVPKKLWPITPLSKMWGIGSRLERSLNRMGIYTVGELASHSLEQLEKKFGVMGNQLYYHAHGIDLSELGEPILQKPLSYGKSQVLLKDYRTVAEVAVVILEMSEEVGKRARANRSVGRTISLGIKYSKHEGGGGFHRSQTMQTPTNLTLEIYETCMYLLQKFYNEQTVRQISITLSNLCPDTNVQLQLFDHDRLRERTMDYTIDAIHKKHGPNTLLRAISYTEAGTKQKRNQLVGGHFA